jgi:hypothetical protein
MFYRIRWLNQGIGIINVYGTGVTPWKVDKIHVVFDQYTKDDLLKFRMLYFVSKEALEIIRQNQFTGLGICHPVETEINDEYIMSPHKIFKQYYVLEVQGIAGQDDIGIAPGGDLVISRNVLCMLSKVNMPGVKIEELELIKYLRKKFNRGV